MSLRKRAKRHCSVKKRLTPKRSECFPPCSSTHKPESLLFIETEVLNSSVASSCADVHLTPQRQHRNSIHFHIQCSFPFNKDNFSVCGTGWLSRYSNSLRSGLSGDRIPVGGGAIFPAPVQTGPRAHPASIQCVPALFPGGIAVGA